MYIKATLISLLQRAISILTATSETQRILLNHGIYSSVLSLIGFETEIPSMVKDYKVVSAFEQACYDKLRTEEIDQLMNKHVPIDEIVGVFMDELKIEPRCRHLCKDAIIKMRTKLLYLASMNELADTPVNRENDLHCQMLHEVWKALDDREPPASFEVINAVNKGEMEYSSWGDLGFQNPFTDFRMTGLLGLKCMHNTSNGYAEKARDAYSKSNKLQAWFPYALTSINVTAWVLEDMRNNKIAAFYYSDEEKDHGLFYDLHAFYFFSFVKHWEACGARSILDFKAVSEKFRKHVLLVVEEMVQNYIGTECSLDKQLRTMISTACLEL